ncbi:MAG TPA: PH domain-containing protein [Bryobacteraceae bacterium]|nr:PH domain-containing protein [Bryobacteraceae bacterium]
MTPRRAEFTASYDRSTKIISAVVCVFLLVSSLAAQQVFVSVISVVIVALAFAYSPRGYIISSSGTITVRRLIGNVRFPLEGVREARRTTADDVRGSVRLWGSGGMFGYYGLFRTSKLGKCWWYVTNRQNIVVLITDAGTALLSPDDVDGFLGAIRGCVPVSLGPLDAFGDETGRRNWRHSPATWVGIGIAVVSVAVAAVALLYAPGPPSYTLTSDELTIHDRFYPVTVKAAEVDVAYIRTIDITTDKDWRPTVRTNGFANSHYRSGWFRVASGLKVRMYRADGTRLVLLPPKTSGVPVLLDVQEPDRFAAELRRRWDDPQ